MLQQVHVEEDLHPSSLYRYRLCKRVATSRPALPLNVSDTINRTKDAPENRDTYILENSSQNKIVSGFSLTKLRKAVTCVIG